MTLTLQPVHGLPLIRPGDSLARLIYAAMQAEGITLETGDVLVLAQKIVSKAEGRLVNLNTVVPSAAAFTYAEQTLKDPRLIELILRESAEVLRVRPGTIIVQHRLGFVCANAGIDHSNVHGEAGDADDWYLLLPEDPDQSASDIRRELAALTGKQIGVLIIDSHGRAWRLGTVGAAIGFSGLPGLVDLRGRSDIFGYQLRVTTVAAADELAAAASLVMGQAAERIPVVNARGFPYPLREGGLHELIRPKEMDMFR